MKTKLNTWVDSYPDAFIKAVGLILFLVSLPCLAFQMRYVGVFGEWLQLGFHLLILINLIPFVQYRPYWSWMLNATFLIYLLISNILSLLLWGFSFIVLRGYTEYDKMALLNFDGYVFGRIWDSSLVMFFAVLFLNVLLQSKILQIYNIGLKRIYISGLLAAAFVVVIYILGYLTLFQGVFY